MIILARYNRARITEEVATTDVDMTNRIWDEIADNWDICRVKWGHYTEQL